MKIVLRTATTMLKSLAVVTGNGRVDSAGSEQQDRLSEQCGTDLGHRQRPTGRQD